MRRLLGLARALVWPLAFLWLRLVIFVTRPLLILALRAAVRSRTFWLRGLASSWCATCVHLASSYSALAELGW